MKAKKIIPAVIAAVLVIVIAVAAGVFHSEIATVISLDCDTEKGMYVVDYSADYKLDELLEQGGVETEDELAQYIIKIMLKGLPINIEYDVPQLACSTFIAETPEKGYIFGRNLDNQETDLAVVKTAPKDGYKSVSVVNLSFLGYDTEENTPKPISHRINILATPYFPLDGVNEKGLAVGVLQLQAPPTQQDTGKTDVDTTLAIRVLLDKAADLDEAIALLKGFDMHASANGCYHFHIADAKGSSAVISYVNGEMIITRKTDDGYQGCTNFYLHDVPFGDDEYEAQGMDRYEKLMEVLTKQKGILTVDEGMGLLDYAHLEPTEPDAEGRSYTTQWSSLYNLADPSLNICLDKDYENVYTFSIADIK